MSGTAIMPLYQYSKLTTANPPSIYNSFFTQAKKERTLELIVQEIKQLYHSNDAILKQHDELGRLLNAGMLTGCEFIVNSSQLKLDGRINALARFSSTFKLIFNIPADQRLKALGEMCWRIETQSISCGVAEGILIAVRDEYLKAKTPKAKL